MTTNLFVGGLPYEITQEELEKLFASCGKVTHVKLIMDRETGRSKGFGFVEMATEQEAATALRKLPGTDMGGRKIFVTEARPKEERPDAAPSKPAFVPGPGFVERRSGKDRRQAGGFGAPKAWEKPAERRESFGDKPRWGDKPKFGDKPKWGDKPGGFGPKKFGDKPKWGDKPGGFGPKKFGDKPKWGDKPGGFGPKKFGDKPKWGDKPGGSGPKKFGDKPGGFGPKKFGDKPRGFGPKKFGKPGGGFRKRD